MHLLRLSTNLKNFNHGARIGRIKKDKSQQSHHKSFSAHNNTLQTEADAEVS